MPYKTHQNSLHSNIMYNIQIAFIKWLQNRLSKW